MYNLSKNEADTATRENEEMDLDERPVFDTVALLFSEPPFKKIIVK
jgi:hypothetical protein